ncbi:YitT family protein [Clostridioides mangenotii]|uniref:YitT family protein n=1 Tax=Metaclostridioides mangenotii TaxID=1540 RepID=UPI001C10BEBD|nr:YitT family protein [Clostridioides mangenotii]MBU5306230.1 YitT family protein [Clostridioides mangenotii]MCR1955772.1 YitT family protein [Clostridioides mangenotii]
MKKDRITFLEILILIVGCFLMAASLNLFFNPHSIAPGGLTGLAVVINTVSPIPLWVVNLVLNVPLFVLAFKILSRKDCVKTILGILLLTIALKVTENLSMIDVTNDIILAIVSGSILMGFGHGLIFRINGTTGGTDLIGLLLNKYIPSLSVPVLMGAVDCIVVALSGIVTGKIEIALYSTLALYIIVKMSDLMIEGFDYSKSFMIISDKYKDINKIIMEDLERGATILNGEGAYTGSDKKVILVVVAKKEVVKLKKLVKEVDPNSFIIITDIHEAVGNGFKMSDI